MRIGTLRVLTCLLTCLLMFSVSVSAEESIPTEISEEAAETEESEGSAEDSTTEEVDRFFTVRLDFSSITAITTEIDPIEVVNTNALLKVTVGNTSFNQRLSNDGSFTLNLKEYGYNGSPLEITVFLEAPAALGFGFGPASWPLFDSKLYTLTYNGIQNATIVVEAHPAFAVFSAFDGLDNSSGSTLVDGIVDSLESVAGAFAAGDALETADTLFAGDMVNGVITEIYNSVYPLAFVLMVVIWLVSIGKSAITTELYNEKQMLKPLLRLIWGITILSASMPILELIFSVFHGLSSKISVGVPMSLISVLVEESSSWVDDSWVVGGIMTFFNVIAALPKIVVYVGLEVLFGLVFYVIIFIRFIKLAVLQGISPFFFACSAGEKTERYLASFLREYIVFAAQIFVAIVMYSIIVTAYGTMQTTMMIRPLISCIAYLAGMISVAGSGKFIRSLMQ